LHRGIATRAFHKTIRLADTIEVESAFLENGILRIVLVNIVPEEKKPKKIPINYIGKKQLISIINKKLGKKELIAIKEERKQNKVQGKPPTKKKVVQESNWLDYYGSSKPLLEEIKKLGKEKYKREIIQIASNSKQLTYYEALYQMSENVLQRDDSFNDNIAGKWYRKDFS
jgi:hypothetical protein